jgi:hypothetical protein
MSNVNFAIRDYCSLTSLNLTLGLTVLWEVRKIFRLGVPKTRKIKKITPSQDDGFVEEVESFNHGRWFWTGAPCSPHLPRRAVGRTWAENGF